VLVIAADPDRSRQIGAVLGGDARFAITFIRTVPVLIEEEPDLILLAVDFTREGGEELAAALRARGISSSIVLLSAEASAEHALAATASGADDVVTGGEILESLGTRLLLAHARRRREQQLTELVYVDSLTGLRNRRAFAVEGEQQLALTQRMGLPLVLLVLDIDELKEINDKHGHRVGDKALADTAVVLRQTFRRSDLLARVGGDEFAAILRSPLHPSAAAASTRVKQALTEFNQTSRRPYQLRASVGTATAAPGERVPLADVFERADAAMYEEKRRRTASG
jgi:two-component system cell cycle response regulator